MNIIDLFFASVVGAAAMHIYKQEQATLPAPKPSPVPDKKAPAPAPTHPYHARFSLN